MKNREIKADIAQVAACGLYCGACRSFLRGKCPGCRANEKASWCKTRACCLTNNYRSCADCPEDPGACPKFNNAFSRIFGLIFNSDRPACIARIKEAGYLCYVQEMAAGRRMSLPRRKTSN